MSIETIRLKNFKVFKDIEIVNIPRFCVIVGANGSGKTTLFDVFGFLKDCLLYNVRNAVQQRGGFKELRTRNAEGETIAIELQYRMEINQVSRLGTYRLEIGEKENRPYIAAEILRYKRWRYGHPSYMLHFEQGKGLAVVNEEDFNNENKELEREEQKLDSDDILAIKGLGQYPKFQAARAFRRLIENWHVSDIHIDKARGAKDSAGFDEHLSVSGDNLQLVAQNLYMNHPDRFRAICETMCRRVPGISSVEPRPTEDGKILLRFGDGAFEDPFVDRFVSDGTLRMFAYLVLLNDPSPHPLLCVEEPENQLYVDLLPELAEEFRGYAERGGGQVFVSTHSPDFLNACELVEVFWMVKRGGLTEIRRASGEEQIASYVHAGDKLGWLWREGLFAGAHP